MKRTTKNRYEGERCTNCDTGILQYRVKRNTWMYKVGNVTVDQPGHWCNKCPDGVLSGEDIEVTRVEFDRQLKELKAKFTESQDED